MFALTSPSAAQESFWYLLLRYYPLFFLFFLNVGLSLLAHLSMRSLVGKHPLVFHLQERLE